MNPTEATKWQVYWDHLQRLHADEIGWLPAPRVFRDILAGRFIPQTENAEPCGFLLHGPAHSTLTVYQTAIQYDARRRAHATACVQELIRRGQAAGSAMIVLHCAADIQANEFWDAMGFTRSETTVRRSPTGRDLWRWQLALTTDPVALARATETATRTRQRTKRQNGGTLEIDPTLARFLGFRK